VVVGGTVGALPGFAATVVGGMRGTVVVEVGGAGVEDGGVVGVAVTGATAFTEPGCWRATTAPISAVVPAAARVASAVRPRILACTRWRESAGAVGRRLVRSSMSMSLLCLCFTAGTLRTAEERCGVTQRGSSKHRCAQTHA
jgi:hypothetical protein